MKKWVTASDDLTCLSLILAWLIANALPQFSASFGHGEAIVRGVNLVEFSPCGLVTIFTPPLILSLYSFPIPRGSARWAHWAVSVAYILCTTVGTVQALRWLSQWEPISVHLGLPLSILTALAAMTAFDHSYRADLNLPKEEHENNGETR